MAEKKGIRINALAKELGVESKAILHKLKEEGLGDVAPNHMSVIKTGRVAPALRKCAVMRSPRGNYVVASALNRFGLHGACT